VSTTRCAACGSFISSTTSRARSTCACRGPPRSSRRRSRRAGPSAFPFAHVVRVQLEHDESEPHSRASVAAKRPASPKPTITTCPSSRVCPHRPRRCCARRSGARAARAALAGRDVRRGPHEQRREEHRGDAGREQGRAAASSMTPFDCASRVSTNPNSPNCASPTPASHATRDGKRMAMAASVASNPFATRKPDQQRRPERLRATTRTSKSMPRDTKKMLTNASRSGRMSPMARCPYSVSATTMPPRNAPSASDKPSERRQPGGADAQAEDREQEHLAARLASTHPSTFGTTNRARWRPTDTTTTAAFPSRPDATAARLRRARAAPSSGTTSTIGTTQRSWKMSVPTMNRPWGASSSRRSARARSTIAVLESANTKP
jgi:hypothetical protein